MLPAFLAGRLWLLKNLNSPIEHCRRSPRPTTLSGLAHSAAGTLFRSALQNDRGWSEGGRLVLDKLLTPESSGRSRDEMLNNAMSATLMEAKLLIAQWRKECNQVRPHTALHSRARPPEARTIAIPALWVLPFSGAGRIPLCGVPPLRTAQSSARSRLLRADNGLSGIVIQAYIDYNCSSSTRQPAMHWAALKPPTRKEHHREHPCLSFQGG